MAKAYNIDITVVQKPVSVDYECPECEHEFSIPYNEFVRDNGDVCDWDYITLVCPHCGAELSIENIEWD